MHMLFAGKTRKSLRQFSVVWLDPFDKVQRYRHFHSDREASKFADQLEWEGIHPSNIRVR